MARWTRPVDESLAAHFPQGHAALESHLPHQLIRGLAGDPEPIGVHTLEVVPVALFRLPDYSD